MTGAASENHVLPDYLIIGASKTGTSFLHRALRQHPAVYGGAGEVHFFDWNYGRGVEWYRRRFPKEAWRNSVLRSRGAFVTGEKTPNYLFDSAVPERVRRVLPDAKLIVLLRDPVDRAFSHFQHQRRRGAEPLSFERAMASELAASGRPRNYLARGLYAQQLERWLRLFPPRQFHIIQSELMFADPGEVTCDVHRFLGLEPIPPHSVQPLNAGDYAPMRATLRARLRDFYAPELERLSELLPDAPSWWSRLPRPCPPTPPSPTKSPTVA
jgi:Sulfotransferase domain